MIALIGMALYFSRFSGQMIPRIHAYLRNSACVCCAQACLVQAKAMAQAAGLAKSEKREAAQLRKATEEKPHSW
jgi:hypothetical protein